MDSILYYICIPLGVLMKWCWQLVGNYGVAIILFTLATKIVLLPLSVWIHKNNILMVKLQPEINMIKVRNFGNADIIADEQEALFKKHKYHPMLSLVPLALQIVLLLGVVYIINRPLSYLFGISDEAVALLAQAVGANTESSSFQLEILAALKNGTLNYVPGVDPSVMADLVGKVGSFDLTFCGLDLTGVPTAMNGVYYLVPLVAGLSSLVLCLAQNASNVLQHEQSNINKYGTMMLSVAISLYLGFFVPVGTATYWTFGNIFSIIQMYILNAVIAPKKYVDYDALERSRTELKKLEELEPVGKKDARWRENKKREKQDYKRFFGIINKHLVIYSEKSGFYKYFKDIIDELTERSNITVHYITNDPDDVIFKIAETNKRIKPYYIGIKKLIPLMMKLEADMVVMTTPELDKYYLKKSMMKKDVEYVYVPHALMSMHMGMKEGSLDAFDTVFCAGEHIHREVEATVKCYGLPPKTLVDFGYPLVDELLREGERERASQKTDGRREILIAPTWNEDCILDSCIDEMLTDLMCDDYHITVRPHPEYVKRYGTRMNAIVERWADKVGDGLTFELDFSVNRSIYSADIMITDWSGISFEYSFATKRPVLFVNTKMKVLNPNWERIECEPIEITLRNEIGVSIEKGEVVNVREHVEYLLSHSSEYEDSINKALHKAVYNVGSAGRVGAGYILKSLSEKAKSRQNAKTLDN